MNDRPIRIEYCASRGEDYRCGSMVTNEVRDVPTPVLFELAGRLDRELKERYRIAMIVRDVP